MDLTTGADPRARIGRFAPVASSMSPCPALLASTRVFIYFLGMAPSQAALTPHYLDLLRMLLRSRPCCYLPWVLSTPEPHQAVDLIDHMRTKDFAPHWSLFDAGCHPLFASSAESGRWNRSESHLTGLPCPSTREPLWVSSGARVDQQHRHIFDHR